MNNPFVVTGMICSWCYNFLPEEKFKHKYNEGEYFKTCENCRPRPTKTNRDDEWKNERKEYKCECGSVLYLITKNKHNRKQQIDSHNKTIKHKLYENNKHNYEEYIKKRSDARKKKQCQYQKKWREEQKNKCIN
jgi:hypothetical protein